jgi:hypothetical protein
MVQRRAFVCVSEAVLSLLHGQKASHCELLPKPTLFSISSSLRPLYDNGNGRAFSYVKAFLHNPSFDASRCFSFCFNQVPPRQSDY